MHSYMNWNRCILPFGLSLQSGLYAPNIAIKIHNSRKQRTSQSGLQLSIIINGGDEIKSIKKPPKKKM